MGEYWKKLREDKSVIHGRRGDYMKVLSDEKVLHLHTKSFLHQVEKISEAESEICFENYSTVNPISDLKTIAANQKEDTMNFCTFMEEDAKILNAIGNGFQQIDEDMAKGMGKKK